MILVKVCGDRFAYREDAGGDSGGDSTLGKGSGGCGERAKHCKYVSCGIKEEWEGEESGGMRKGME